MRDGKSNREERAKRDPFYADLINICDKMCAASGDRIHLVFGEKDSSGEEQDDAAHFLKMDGRRIGRDIEQFAMLSKITSIPFAAADFLAVMLGVSASLPAAYKAVEPDLRSLKKYFAEEYQKDWDELFEKVS